MKKLHSTIILAFLLIAVSLGAQVEQSSEKGIELLGIDFRAS